jgi:hypothetical protein
MKRDHLISEMKSLREKYGSTMGSIETVRRLLSWPWGRANWRTRQQLIEAADWLVRMEKTRVGILPERDLQRRQKERHGKSN